MALKIIDCTLRDGGNAINFKFKKDLTKNILIGLEKAGVRWIDMGHGFGLGASKKCGKPASLSDEEYMELAKSCLKKAKFGFFFLTKFGEKKDIKLASKKGVNFLRIGSNITEVDQIEEFIKYAKEQGLIVNVCLMKAYAANIKDYIKVLEKLKKWEVNLITLMDSAGTMVPKKVKEYIIQGKVNVGVPLGFHSHNNLQLAIGNSITAIESGAEEIDSSIGGLGRSAGNAPTEILAILLEKYGWGRFIDYKILSDLNDKYIFPLIKGENRFSSKALTFGFAGFHSSFFPLIMKVCKKYPSIDYRDVVLAVSAEEKVNVTEDLIEKIIQNKKNILLIK